MKEVNPSKVFKNLFPKSVVANITVAYTVNVNAFKVVIYRWKTGYWSWRIPSIRLSDEAFFGSKEKAVENANLIIKEFV